jgi:hypothetical protein
MSAPSSLLLSREQIRDFDKAARVDVAELRALDFLHITGFYWRA